MTFSETGRLFLVVWCMAAEQPAGSDFDSSRRVNRDLLEDHPLLAAVMFAAVGTASGALLALAGGLLRFFMPDFGGAVLFAAIGLLWWEYISGWRSTALAAGFVQHRAEYGTWSGDSGDISGGLAALNTAAGTLAAALFILIKLAGFMCIYFAGASSMVIIFSIFPFVVQGLLAHFDGEKNIPVLSGGRAGQIYLLAAAALIIFCGIAAAPAALAAAVLFCWIIYEITSRKCRERYDCVPLNCITLAGSIAEISTMFAALILIG